MISGFIQPRIDKDLNIRRLEKSQIGKDITFN